MEAKNGTIIEVFGWKSRDAIEVFGKATVRQVRHYGSLKEIDMSIIVLIVLGGMAIMRYLSMETGESSLKFFGGAALVLMIVFRNIFSGSKRKVF